MSPSWTSCLSRGTSCGSAAEPLELVSHFAKADQSSPPRADQASEASTTSISLAARAPLELTGQRRDNARLLVATRSSQRLAEARMADLTNFLDPGDVLVVNTSGTLPSAIEVDNDLVVHLSTELSTEQRGRRSGAPRGAGSHVQSTWVVELRRRAGHGSMPWRGYRPSAPISLPAGAVLEILAPYAPNGRSEPPGSTRLWTARLSVPQGGRSQHTVESLGEVRADASGERFGPVTAELTERSGETTGLLATVQNELLEYLAAHGRPIRYGADAQPWPLASYQTIFAVEPGSAEMPSAGRGFTAELVTDLVSHGVTVAPIVLHTGVASQEAGEVPYPEQYRVPEATAAAVNAARASGRRVIAVGTTATRAIETAAGPHGQVEPSEGWTDLVVTPERGVRAINGLVTGWHDPEASHLMLVEAVAGSELLDRSYEQAIAAGFAGHEFGDFHLILP